MKFINLTVILMFSSPSAQVLAIDSKTDAEEYIINSELFQHLNQDAFQFKLDENVNYTEDMYGEKNNIDGKGEDIPSNELEGKEAGENVYIHEKASGRDVDDLLWSLDGTTLTINGGIYETQIVPWDDSKKSITKINIIAPIVIARSDKIDLLSGYPNVTAILGLENLEFSGTRVDLQHFFSGNSSLESVTFQETFKVSNVINLSQMFFGCSSLESVTFPESMDTRKIEYLNGMFMGCSSLKRTNFFEVFDTRALKQMSQLFAGCSSLESITFPETFDTSKVRYISGAFQDCSSLKRTNLFEVFDTSALISMDSLFAGCSSLESIAFPETFDTSKVSLINGMFDGCYQLTTITLGSNFKSLSNAYLPNFKVSSGYKGLWIGETTKKSFLSSGDFMENYTAEFADSYTWSVYTTDITNYSVSLEDQIYSGFDQTPSIALRSPIGILLTESINYNLAFSNNLNAGTANITIKGKGGYVGEINKTFEITPATPTIEKLPSTTDLMANSILGESIISDGVVNGVGNDGKLTGQFKWKTPNNVVTESGEYTIVFTPTGVSEGNYKPIETQVFVNVTKLSNVIPPVNIDHSSPPIELENTNSDRGTGLSIRYVSGLDFGQKELSFSEQKLSAKEDQAVNKETGTSETFENMITVEDGRGIRNGWVLTVRQYSEFNDGTVLEMNPNVDGRNGQGVFTGSNKLALNGLSQTVAWAKNSERQMAGSTSIGFGEVTLTIPKGGGVGEKQNSLMWELIDGPVPP